MSLQGGSVPFFSSFLLTRPCTYLMAGTWAHIWMDTELLMIWSSHTNSGLSTSRSLHIRENQVSGFVVALVAKLCPTLCHPMNCSTPGSSVHGILQARILEWVAVPFSKGSSQPRNWTGVSCIASRFFTNWAIREAQVGQVSPGWSGQVAILLIRYHRLGGLINRNLFLTVLKVGKCKIEVLIDSFPQWGVSSWLADINHLTVSPHGRTGEEVGRIRLFGVYSCKETNPSRGPHPHDLS